MPPNANPDLARAPAAASGSTPASSGLPSSSHMLHWMRTMTGYAPVVSARFSAACSPFRRSTAARFGRRRPNPGEADVAAYLALIPTISHPTSR